MRIDDFRYFFKSVNAFWLTETHMLMRKPLELYDTENNTNVEFSSMDEAFAYEVDGATIEERICAMNELRISPLEGGRGADSGSNKTFKFDHARGGGADQTHDVFPAYANTRIKEKSFEAALKQFSDSFKDADHEYGYVVDDQGFVHTYREGNRDSIMIHGSKQNHMVLHNHPSGGHFSDSDLLSVSQSREGGIVAAGNKYNYIFRKGTHFQTNKFIKAIKTARFQGRDYDDAVHKWLKRNAKKYGYSYERQRI